MNTKLFRYFLAIHQIWLLSFLLRDSWSWFGKNQMVTLRTPDFPTVFDFFNQSPVIIQVFLGMTIVIWGLFALDKLNRWGQVLLFFLNVSIHNANPYIIHEPQQMVNLLLMIQIFFLPSSAKQPVDKNILQILSVFLGVYYLLAGLKKLPDALWLHGQALEILLLWPPFFKGNLFTLFLKNNSYLLVFTNYLVLVFELLFLPLLFSRLRRWLFLLGLLIHLGISASMEVGTFSWIMLCWYLLVFPVEAYVKTFAYNVKSLGRHASK
ncbi:MAG: hypothetical protein B7Y39_14130 [Bdellovibrio sp. 28-41-41]|nr:MAG: hypothetical protein B7Y39_14130 [Bdellovibrio sp. 28-41-41]